MVSPGCSVSLTLLFNINRFKCVKGKMYKITYLNCTLTVSSNKHVGLLEKKKKKKRHYQNLPLLFSPTYFLDEATEKKLFLSLTLEVYLISKGFNSSYIRDAFKVQVFISYIP